MALLEALPDELLPLIINNIYQGSGCFPRSIFSVSRTCKTLREASLPFLFETVTLLARQVSFKRQSFQFLQHVCNSNPGIGRHVRHLRLRMPLRKGYEESHENVSIFLSSNVSEALNLMSGLKSISFDCIGDLMISILNEVQDRYLEIKIDTRPGERILIDSPFATALPPVSSFWTWSFSCDRRQIWDPIAPITSIGKVKAVEWSHPGGKDGQHLIRDNDEIELFGKLETQTENIEELHFSEMLIYLNGLDNLTYAPEIADLVLRHQNLCRLSVEVSEATEAVLAVLPELSNLQDLSLYSAHRKAFHPSCEGDSFPTTDLSYLNLPKLKNLDIRYICKDFEISQILPKKLEGLRLEFFGKNERLTPTELDWLLETSPNLERLELDIGSFDRLWRNNLPTPSSTSSSDFMQTQLEETKRLLDRLCKFKRLRVLRLFPTYWTASGNFITEPLSEQTAVRLFNHIHNRIPALTLLVIHTTLGEYPMAFSQSYIQPTKYVLRSLGGGRTVLTTGQALKSYDMEQVWEGDQRLTMRNRPHTYWKPFFEDLTEGWTLSTYEMPRYWGS